MKNIYQIQNANKIRSNIIVVLFFAFIFLAAYILTNAFGYYMGYQPGGLGYFGIALILSGISSFVSYYYSDKIVLGISGARPATTAEDKLFVQVVDNLCIGSGLPRPKLFVIDDPSPNAFATGRDPEHAVICATSGLLSKLNRNEMEGVFGHELTHIKNLDTRLMAVVAVMVGLVSLLGDWFLRSMWPARSASRSEAGGWGGDRDDNSGSFFIVLGIIFAILSPFVGTLIQMAISRKREFIADAGSVEITKQPGDLISALQKIANDPYPLKSANKATAHLYIENPFKKEGHGKAGWFSEIFDTHPPIAERIKVLKSLI